MNIARRKIHEFSIFKHIEYTTVCKRIRPIWLSDYNTCLGEYDDDIDFTYDTNTETYKSCSAILNDEMYVFGGGTHKRQVNFWKRELLLNNIIDK